MRIGGDTSEILEGRVMMSQRKKEKNTEQGFFEILELKSPEYNLWLFKKVKDYLKDLSYWTQLNRNQLISGSYSVKYRMS